MRNRKMLHRLCLTISVLFFSSFVLFEHHAADAEAGVLFKSVTRAAARKAAARKATQKAAQHKAAQKSVQKKSSSPKNYREILKRDAVRDRKSVAKPLEKSRKVNRYTSTQNAARAKRYGMIPGTHMTSGVQKGRPLSAKTAKKRFGLAAHPEAKMTILLPKGLPVKKNKVIGGKPGFGEITSPAHLPRETILRIDKIQ